MSTKKKPAGKKPAPKVARKRTRPTPKKVVVTNSTTKDDGTFKAMIEEAIRTGRVKVVRYDARDLDDMRSENAKPDPNLLMAKEPINPNGAIKAANKMTGMNIVCDRIKSSISRINTQAEQVLCSYQGLCSQFGPNDSGDRDTMSKEREAIMASLSNCENSESLWHLSNGLVDAEVSLSIMTDLLEKLIKEVF